MPSSVADDSMPTGPVIHGLEGARVLVTGASGGIGAGIAEAFGRCHASVGVHYNTNREAAYSVVTTIKAVGGESWPLQADLRQTDSATALVEAFVEAAGGLDVLVNNAGGPELLRPVADLSDEEFDQIFDLNARSVFAACRAAIPHLRRNPGRASIINVTSLSARLGSGPGASIYGASKAFISAMSKTLARELAPDGVRVNALSPGFVATPLHDKVSSPQLVANWLNQIPMGRGGEPADCAGVALFLASPGHAGFLTGQVIEVNGGQYMGG